MKTTITKLSKGDDGFASIVIAIILVLVLSLMTVGFADLMRKETRSALDKQLSSQASLAAETGINDAAKALNSGFAFAKTQCGPLKSGDMGYMTAGWDTLGDNKVSANTASSYTCLTIDPAPDTLEYGAIDFNQSKAVTISGVKASDGVTGVAIGTLTISWQDSNGGQDFVSGPAALSHKFKTASDWSSTGLLRVGLTPLGVDDIGRDAMIRNTSTLFLYPNSAPSPSIMMNQYNTATQAFYTGQNNSSGGIVDGSCNPGSRPRPCNVNIAGLNQQNYLLDLRSVYRKTKVTISAYDTLGSRIKIRNAQTLIDSTGKAQDVLKRVQVRIPTRTEYFHSDFSLQTAGDICKQLRLTPDSGSNTCQPIIP